MSNTSPDRPSPSAVVIGGGIAGLTAATRLAEFGLSACVLERSSEDSYVCNSRLTAGVFHCALTSVSQPSQYLKAAIDQATAGAADSGQAQAIADDALRAIRWLQQGGARFIRGAAHYHDFTLAPPNIDPRDGGWRGRGGDLLLRTMESKLLAAGGRFLRGHRAKSLLMAEHRCVGVEGLRTDNTPFSIQTAHVVIADGGFQTDHDLLRKGITPAPERVFQRNARTGLGDGLRMALDAGALISALNGFYGHMLSADAFSNDRLWPHLWLDFVAAAGILVDRSGHRFTDEGQGGVGMANHIAQQSDPLGCFVIADQAIWNEQGRLNMQAPNPRLQESGGTVIMADTIDDLARGAGIDPDALKHTVAQHNTAIVQGRLQTLTPPRTIDRFAAHPISRAPYVALPAAAGITYTMGGIFIDGNARVLNQSRQPMPGLYAVGAATGGLEGGGPRTGYVGGLIKSVVTGIRAAEHIAAELRGRSVDLKSLQA